MPAVPLKQLAPAWLMAMAMLLGFAAFQAAGAEEPENISILKRRAETGLASAQYILGNAYVSGDGVPEDTAEAAKWFKKAAEQGQPEAQFNLGMMYYEGAGVPLDRAEAVKWYTAAAKRGIAEAAYNLAICYSKGEGIQQNHSEAFRWYLAAAEAWDTRAQVQVGLAYRDGIGVERNETEAIKWLRRAAYQNDAGAQYALALVYASTNTPAFNQEDAARWIKRSAEQGYAPAIALQKGETNLPIASIQAEAAKTLLAKERQPDGGSPLLSKTNSTGTEIELSSFTTNSPVASKIETVQTNNSSPFGQLSELTNTLKLADAGVAEAQWNIAISHLLGDQGEADIEKAIPWLEKAALQHHTKAQALLNKLTEYRTGQANTAAPILATQTQPVQQPPVASSEIKETKPTSGTTQKAPLGLPSVLMISLGSSLLVIGGTAALLMAMLKTRFSRIQRELFETKLELAEANRSVTKLTSIIEAKILEASLEPPPLAGKAARPLPEPKNTETTPDPGVDFKARRSRSKTSSEGSDKAGSPQGRPGS
jgi:TPR repeat protein